MFASLSELWLARGDHERATEFADRTLNLATHPNSRKNLAKGWRLRGYIAFARRPLDDAETAFRHALTFAEAIGNPAQRWAAHAALGRSTPLGSDTTWPVRPTVARGRYSTGSRLACGSLGLARASIRRPAVRRLRELVGSPEGGADRQAAAAARRRAVSSGRIASVTGSSATP